MNDILGADLLTVSVYDVTHVYVWFDSTGHLGAFSVCVSCYTCEAVFTEFSRWTNKCVFHSPHLRNRCGAMRTSGDCNSLHIRPERVCTDGYSLHGQHSVVEEVMDAETGE